MVLIVLLKIYILPFLCAEFAGSMRASLIYMYLANAVPQNSTLYRAPGLIEDRSRLTNAFFGNMGEMTIKVRTRPGIVLIGMLRSVPLISPSNFTTLTIRRLCHSQPRF